MLIISTFLIVTCLAIFSDLIKNKLFDFLSVFFTVTLLSILSASRSSSVGTDTETYIYYFSKYNFGLIDWVNFGIEPLFGWIVNLCNYFNFSNYFWYFLVFSLIFNGFMVSSVYKLKNRTILISIFLGYSTLYFYSFNVIRQSIAISIFFYSLFFLVEGKIVKYFILTIIASLFHYSALFNLFFILFRLLGYNVRLISFIIPTLVGSYFLTTQYLIGFLSSLTGSDKASNYIDKVQVEGGISRFVIILFIFVISYIFYFRYSLKFKSDIFSKLVFFLLLFLMSFQFFIAFLGLPYEGPGRIVTYYYLAFLLVIYCVAGKLLESVEKKIIFGSFILILNYIYLYMYLINGGHGVLPFVMNTYVAYFFSNIL